MYSGRKWGIPRPPLQKRPQRIGVVGLKCMFIAQFFKACLLKKRYQYKRRTHKRRTPQTSDSTNVGRTNVRPVQTLDQYKRRTSTNVGLVQTSDQSKRRTGTFIKKNVGLGRFRMDHCFKKFQTMNSTRSYSLIPISLPPAVVDLRYFKL